MTLKVDTNGLPLPGRELDAAVWGMLGHEVEWWWSYEDYEYGLRWFAEKQADLADPEAKALETWVQQEVRSGEMVCQPWYMVDSNLEIVPFVSTSSALFQVMEAMCVEVPDTSWQIYSSLTWDEQEGCWKRSAEVTLGYGTDFYTAEVFTKEHNVKRATAHAVCAAAYLAEKGENA